MLKYSLLIGLTFSGFMVISAEAALFETPQMPVNMALSNAQETEPANPFEDTTSSQAAYMIPIPAEGIESLLPEGLSIATRAYTPDGIDIPCIGRVALTHRTEVKIDYETGTVTPVDHKLPITLGAETEFTLDLEDFPNLHNTKFFAFYVYPHSAPVNLHFYIGFKDSAGMYYSKYVPAGRLPKPSGEESGRLIVVNLDRQRAHPDDQLISVTINFNNGPSPSHFKDGIPAILTNICFIGETSEE
jgi:hypothetical protein